MTKDEAEFLGRVGCDGRRGATADPVVAEIFDATLAAFGDKHWPGEGE